MTSSNNTLQVPDVSYQAESYEEPRRRSLSSLQEEKETCRRQDRRASAPPVRRASCVWGDIWDLRNLLSMKRKFSASSSDCQVRLLRRKGLCLFVVQEDKAKRLYPLTATQGYEAQN